MNTMIVKQPQIQMIGLHARTTNEEEAGPRGKLPGLWEAFFGSGITSMSGIINPHRVYALYTDYENGVNGLYSVVIGHEVQGGGSPDSSLVHAVIPAGDYKVFTSRRGPVHRVVAEAWAEIWAYFREAPEVRTYTGDYELYDSAQGSPDDMEVRIYIAVKSRSIV